MSAQTTDSPGPNDIVYDAEPKSPWFVEWGVILSWIVVLVFLLPAAILSRFSVGFSIVLVVLAFTLSFLVFTKSQQAARNWFGAYRWYRSAVDKVQVTSSLSNYQQALQKGVVVLKMSNRHTLEFENELPPDLKQAHAVIYQARYIGGEFEHRYVQPSP